MYIDIYKVYIYIYYIPIFILECDKIFLKF